MNRDIWFSAHMAAKEYFGTNNADEIDTYELSKIYPNFDFDIYGLGGDDTLSATFLGRDGVDTVEGGFGDDFMAASVYASGFASALFIGDEGTDSLHISNKHILVGSFSRPYSNITEFKIRSKDDGSIMNVAIDDSTEFISLQLSDDSVTYLLTEDIAKGRIRAVTWEELYSRTHEGNADWYLNGLDTYSSLFDSILALEGISTPFTASSWTENVFVNRVLIGENNKGVLQAKLVDKDSWSGPTGSVVAGTAANDVVRGLGGWDILSGSDGNDLVHGGNGRDIISGNRGSDELHGDFGLNTYLSEIDGSVDLIAIKSDQFLSNWWYGKAGNSPNGEKADIIEGLDANDQIKIIGVATSDLTFRDSITHRGLTGVGIYAKGVLEALYTGSNLNAYQISNITSGDNSATAMANRLWSYWGDNTVPSLQV